MGVLSAKLRNLFVLVAYCLLDTSKFRFLVSSRRPTFGRLSVLQTGKSLLGEVFYLRLQFPDLNVFFGQLGGEHRDEFVVSGVHLAQRDHTVGARIRRGGLVVNVRHARRLHRGRVV
jgi:hypothetical protein